MAENVPVIIIGGGPAGLSLSYELGRLRKPSVILEAGAAVGSSWSQMPRHLKLLSPWSQNVLFERRTNWWERYTLKPARYYAEYLAGEAARFSLNAVTGVAVRSVLPTASGFEVQTDRGTWRSQIVVNATGYFAEPFTPELPGLSSTAIPTLHFHGFEDAARLESDLRLKGRRALIVGKRVSGGQLIEELSDAGFDVSLCCRSPVTFARPTWMQYAVFPFYFAVEKFIASRSPAALDNSYPPMQAGAAAKLIRSGRVRTLPCIERLESNAVVFADGSREQFDIIIFATGFLPALRHLRGLVSLNESGLPKLNGMESAEMPGLFFLGLDNQRTFRSRYLRGIRDDARQLASELSQRLTGQGL